MVVTTCNEQRPRFETELLPSGMTLVRLYEDEQAVERAAVGEESTTWHGYQYTTYEMRTLLSAGGVDAAPDLWAEMVKQADYNAAAAAVRAERDRLIASCDWTVLGDAKTVKADWRTYRQALRDVPEQAGFPYDVTWPVRPEE